METSAKTGTVSEVDIHRLLRPNEVGGLLGIKERIVRRMMRNGKIRSDLMTETKNGRRYYVTTMGAVQEYQRTLGNPSPPHSDDFHDQRSSPRKRLPRSNRIIHVE